MRTSLILAQRVGQMNQAALDFWIAYADEGVGEVGARAAFQQLRKQRRSAFVGAGLRRRDGVETLVEIGDRDV